VVPAVPAALEARVVMVELEGQQAPAVMAALKELPRPRVLEALYMPAVWLVIISRLGLFNFLGQQEMLMSQAVMAEQRV